VKEMSPKEEIQMKEYTMGKEEEGDEEIGV